MKKGPVCGMRVDVSQAARRTYDARQTPSVEAPLAWRKFVRNPERYVVADPGRHGVSSRKTS